MVSEIRELSEELLRLSREYNSFRQHAHENKKKAEIILASKLSDFLMVRRNAGVDVLYLMLRQDCEESSKYIDAWHGYEAKYRGIEKVMNALQERINVEKLIIKMDGSID